MITNEFGESIKYYIENEDMSYLKNLAGRIKKIWF